jgi:A/G-specific adenine glycosylase
MAEARSALLAHYDREARDLPWRRDDDPYRVLVSEIMLQQTRVETVLGYYDRWLDRFPTLDALADADEEEVLKAWEGLGYYRRARNLHRAAQVVREERAGEFPTGVADLRALPGVGEYTAGAVASIAFGEAVPAVDGNVRRVLARMYDVPSPTARWLRETAAAWVDERRPGDWNQALMELGATICTPRGPRCDRCPVARWCRALEAGTVADRPAPPKKRVVPTARIVLAVVHDGDRVLLERRPDDGLLGGLWAFPEERLSDGAAGTIVAGRATAEARTAERHAAERMAESLGFERTGRTMRLEPVRHAFTHLDAHYLPFAIAISDRVARPDVPDPERYRWVDHADDSLPMPVAQRKVFDGWRSADIDEACS